MSRRDLVAGLLETLDDDALAFLAERLRPHLTEVDELLDAREAAARLGLHERTVVRMAREGRIPGAEKIGRGWRFHPDRLTPGAPVHVTDESRPRRPRPTAHRGVVSAIRGAG